MTFFLLLKNKQNKTKKSNNVMNRYICKIQHYLPLPKYNICCNMCCNIYYSSKTEHSKIAEIAVKMMYNIAF